MGSRQDTRGWRHVRADRRAPAGARRRSSLSSPDVIDVRAREAGRGEVTCPLCRERLAGGGAACGACGTRYHYECMAELGGCSTLGCSARGAAPAVPTCAECGELAPVRLMRWPCPCGAIVHDGCLDRHAQGCEPARRLRPVAEAPGPLAWRTRLANAAASALMSQLLMSLGGALVLHGNYWGVFLALASVTLLLEAVTATLERGHHAGADRAVKVALAALLVPGVGLLVWGALLAGFTARARRARARADQ